MIVPDNNLLVYAYDSESPYHIPAVRWWEGLMNGDELVGLPWAVATGFIRIITNPRILNSPIPPLQAVDHVRQWLEIPHVFPINPGPDHMGYFRQNIAAVGRGGNNVPDAHIAALAMERNAEVHTRDRGFQRFPGLRWRDPLVGVSPPS